MKQFIKMIAASCLGVVVASVIVFFLFFTMLGSFISSITASFSSPDAPAKVKKISEGSVLLLDLSGNINDRKTSDFYSDFSLKSSKDKNYPLHEIIKSIEIATKDPKVEAIILKLEKSSMGFATAQELRKHLDNFRKSGKPIYSYSDRYDFGNYYVSSVADKVYMNPYGFLNISGLSSTTIFYPGILKKVGVEMQVFKVGTFKGAVEPFVNTKLSEANKMQIQTYLDGLWNSTKEDIATSRGILSDSIQAYANRGGLFNEASEAIRLRLVDSLMYGADFKEVIAMNVLGDKKAEVEYLSVAEVIASEKKALRAKGDVAVIFAEGAIADVSDNSLPGFGSGEKVINRALISQLREVADDDDVKAVVLRVNSPGGDAFLSELIHHEVKKLKEKKPIVVSMGNYAASGGYYISCEASKIYADPFTLTGSIGIFGMFPNFTGLAQKLDVTHETVKTAQLADFGEAYRPMTAQEKEVLQDYIERGYDTFITRVAEGRGMTKAQVDSVGQGRVWLGMNAVSLGLVDQLGNLADAISEAARLADLGSDYTVGFDKKQTKWFEELLNLSMSDVKGMINYSFILSPEEQLIRKHVQRIRNRTGIMALPPYDIEAITPDMGKVEYKM
ncbi:signal peptide peptidase SppA [Porphyromonas sp.]|uniref:signal peptide peptidase SppA n=1 Tax=Porphyromonas sp. TaxID=1924944 RepID=UPI0026DB6E41|nr:signal peptide peptidase SppA [Porphyromonas sp.]MDO4771267.1 signal peptide peptidase SppA [Porphyromonas sp.]